jgi:MinD-like ATPase involved in chromosome partitioning or flagellar assembly
MDREQATPTIRVVVAAPFAMIVAIHGRAAEYADEIDFCGATSDASRVLEQVLRLQPEVLLLSEDLGFDDADFFTQLSDAAPATRLVMLVDGDASASRSFADVVVSRDAVADELRAAILTAARRVDAPTAPPAHSGAGDHGGSAEEPPPAAAGFEGDSEQAGAPTSGVAKPPAETEQPTVPASAPPADAHAEAPERLARTVLVFSGKGGVGKSVVATNLATALAVGGSRVALVDLNLQYGDVGVLLHLEGHSTTIDALAGAAAAAQPLDAALVEGAMAVTAEGLRVLLAPRSPEFADLVTAASLGAILTEVGRTHDYLVVDSPAHLEERILGVMEVADQILMVTSSNITAVKDTKMTLRLLQSLGIEPARVAIILNQTRARTAFPAEDIERALRFPLLANLPHEPRMDESLDNGRPLVLSEPRSAFSKQLQLVVDHLGRERAASAVLTPRERPAKWRLRFGPR